MFRAEAQRRGEVFKDRLSRFGHCEMDTVVSSTNRTGGLPVLVGRKLLGGKTAYEFDSAFAKAA